MRWEELQSLVEDFFTAREKPVTNMSRVSNKGKGAMLHNNI
jgi:hypothetical protein